MHVQAEKKGPYLMSFDVSNLYIFITMESNILCISEVRIIHGKSENTLLPCLHFPMKATNTLTQLHS
jgi:hypothetical protein